MEIPGTQPAKRLGAVQVQKKLLLQLLEYILCFCRRLERLLLRQVLLLHLLEQNCYHSSTETLFL